jgi:peptide deformylase
MTLLPIHLLGSPILRQHSAEVTTVDDEVRRLINDMFETMDAAKGVGLAANQVGVARRVAVVDADEDRFVMVNPRILEAEGRIVAEEGCLSIPEIYADVNRPERSSWKPSMPTGYPTGRKRPASRPEPFNMRSITWTASCFWIISA